MTLILDALYGLGIINQIEHIPAKHKIRGYPMLQISLSLIVKVKNISRRPSEERRIEGTGETRRADGGRHPLRKAIAGNCGEREGKEAHRNLAYKQRQRE